MSQANQLKSFEDEQTEHSYQKHSPNGNLITLWHDSNGEPRLMLGPHYPLFFVALGVCAALVIFVVYSYFQKFSPFWKVMVSLSGSGFIISYLIVGFSKPGIARPTEEPTQQMREAYRFCNICGLLKSRRTEHCADCDVCIEGFDHHCPWVGKCIGRNNLCAFYTFLIMTFSNIIVIFVATATVNLAHPQAKAA